MLLRNVGVMYQTARCHNPEHLNDTFTPFCTTTLYTANTVLPEKLTGYQQLKFPHFKEPESPLPYSKESSTCPYPEPDRSNPSPIPLVEDPILILSYHFCLVLSSILLTSNFSPLKPCMHHYSPTLSATCPGHLRYLVLAVTAHTESFCLHQVSFQKLVNRNCCFLYSQCNRNSHKIWPIDLTLKVQGCTELARIIRPTK